MDATLAPGVAVHLAHALVQAVAQNAGVRVLFIKGPALFEQDLRAPKVSSDVDVLVDPNRVVELTEAMVAVGWDVKHAPKGPATLGPHSINLIRSGWACSVDLHHYFPGIFAAPGDAFEFLWSRRESVVIAATAVDVPDRAAHACIAGLNFLKDHVEHPESAPIVPVLATFPEGELLEIADHLRARETLRPVLEAAGVPVGAGDLSPAELRSWMVRRSTITTAWLEDIRNAPLLRKPGALWRALWVSKSELGPEELASASGFGGMMKVRLARIAKGFHALPRVARAYATARKQDSQGRTHALNDSGN